MKKEKFLYGLHDGIPIGLGYLAVSFGLGISCRTAHISPFQGFLLSLLNNASAREYGGITVIAGDAGFLMMVLMMLVVNARYMLMSCALSQRLSPKLPLIHRLVMGFYSTDELFAITVAQPELYVNPWYTYGAVVIASPCWALGTALGIIAGNLLPLRLTSAFSVALYGMFLAVIVPPARKSRVIAGLILVCFAASYAASALPLLSGLSAGMRTILLTVILSAAAAALFPVEQKKEDEHDA